ncbi:hypothetical protein Nepgr_014983 [Nepenthes gracilis]|uniref:Uncharacterized protein n=1 Tax=Nepenthes gracilis TaxID=150966 RepID=A0AAD3SMA8_NEPGR|nr:hypothetical protein Nepgr_014983 [Nepenthes gracilis]
MCMPTVATSANSQEKAYWSSERIVWDVAAAAKIDKVLRDCMLKKNIATISIFLKRGQPYHGATRENISWYGMDVCVLELLS